MTVPKVPYGKATDDLSQARELFDALRRLDGSLPFGCHSWTKRRMRRAWRGIIPAAK